MSGLSVNGSSCSTCTSPTRARQVDFVQSSRRYTLLKVYLALGDGTYRPIHHRRTEATEVILHKHNVSNQNRHSTPLGTLLTNAVHGKLWPDQFSLVLFLSHSKYLRLPPLMGSAMTSGTSYSWLALTCSVKAFRRDSLVLMMSNSSASVCTFPSHQ